MSEERYNLTEDYHELSQKFGIDEEEYSEDSFRNDMRRYAILEFMVNPKRDGLMAYYKRKVTFLDWNYKGEPIEPGDHVLCTVVEDFEHNVATPVMKITPSILMGFSNEMRDAIINALWAKNKKDYEEIFEKRYKNEIYERAKTDLAKENEPVFAEYTERIEDLTKQLAAARFAMDVATKDTESDEIELSSEPIEERVDNKPDSRPMVLDESVGGTSEEQRPRSNESGILRSDYGMQRYRELFAVYNHSRALDVQRISNRAIFSESFEDGRYFVHVSPNKKLMLIRQHEEGEVFCVNHQLMIQDLERLYPFTEKKSLKAEYSSRYDGVLVHLDL